MLTDDRLLDAGVPVHASPDQRGAGRQRLQQYYSVCHFTPTIGLHSWRYSPPDINKCLDTAADITSTGWLAANLNNNFFSAGHLAWVRHIAKLPRTSLTDSFNVLKLDGGWDDLAQTIRRATFRR